MQVPLEISTRLIDLTPPLEAELRRRAAKLDRYYDRITSCRIAVERESNHHQEGGPFRVRVSVTVPGSELVANKAAEDLNSAVRAAFSAAERQVDDFSRIRRGEVKTPVGPPHGTIVRLFADDGFGFIQTEDGREVYFHRNAVIDDFDRLEVGMPVRYAETQGAEGPQASTVSPIGRED